MSDFAEFRAKGRAALLSGRATHDTVMVEGAGRWGTTALLRPQGEIVDRMTELVSTLDAPGHWVHRGPTLHITLRTLEAYRSDIPPDDPLRRACAEALARAADGLPPARARLTGVSPHGGGIVLGVRPDDDTLATLRKRFAHALGTRGVRDYERGRVRDRWYVSLVHFARPLTNPGEIVEWCDAHADTDFGPATLPTAEIVRYAHTGTGIHVDSLEQVRLTG
ncbi:hypothetical protein AB0I81_57165 [Nonomuraea sp. NPDC050404]|uniref:hypothetical protein n=1 Tax=Nonomuraea sp. NPDC050404 TaxID=3155783 RepID=UPI003400BF6E